MQAFYKLKDMSNSSKIRQGLLRAVTGGKVSINAPFGYAYTIVNGDRTLVPDSKAPMVRGAFTLYSTKGYSINQLATYLEKEYNVPLVRSTLNRILKNPFYYGKLVYKGEYYDHKYEPLITKDLYDQVQEVLNGRTSKKPPTGRFLPFLFRKLILCGVCNRYLTPERKKKKKYVYYSCHRYVVNHPAKSIREGTITDYLRPIFKKYGIEDQPFNDPLKMRVVFNVLFHHVSAYPDGSLSHESKELIDSDSLIKYLNGQIQQYNSSIKEVIKEEINKYTHPILRYCKTPRTIEEIADELDSDIVDIQMQLMDLQITDQISEMNDGRWQSL